MSNGPPEGIDLRTARGLRYLTGSVSGLWALTGFLTFLSMFFLFYYPTIRSFKFTYFESIPPGLLVSERFLTVDSWITGLFVLTIWTIFWTGFTIANWKLNWPKVLHLIITIFFTLWWIACLVIFLFFIVNANVLSEPTNPANDYRYCCAPEHFPFVATCPNFPADPCVPPITQADLRINGDILLATIVSAVLAAMYIVYIVLVALMMRYAREVLRPKSKMGEEEPLSPLEAEIIPYQPVTSAQRVTQRKFNSAKGANQ